MSFLTRRGAAAFAVASVLLFAPLVSTAAYADEVPVVEAPVIETPSEEAPAEEAPAAPADEAPAAPAEEAPAAPADEAPAALTEEAPEALADSAPSADLMTSAVVCEYTSTYQWVTLCVDVTGTSATSSITTSSWGEMYGYYFYIIDRTTGTFLYNTNSRTPATSSPAVTLQPGHSYTFYADDAYYGVNVNFTFEPREEPNAPSAVAATRLSAANGFALSWEAPTAVANNPVIRYDVAVTPTSSGVASAFTTAELGYELTGLTIGEEYTIAVTAVAEDGQTSSPAITTATLEATVPTAVTGLTLTRDGDELSASWTAPSYNGGASPVHYAVYLYADGVRLDSFDQTSTSKLFPRNAAYSVEYTVEVVPFTQPLNFGPSTTSNAVERADSVLGAPTAYAEAYGYKQPIVYATWDLAAMTGSNIQSINVTLYDVLGAVVAHEQLSPAYSGWNFHGLANDTAYWVGISVTNGAGTSSESIRVPATTLGSVPPPFTPEELLEDENWAGVTVGLTGSTLTAHINGLTAGDWVYGFAHSTPVGLGWTQVDAAGNATWSIAGAGLPAGAHTLAVLSSFGDHLGSAGFTIAAAPAALAHAGADPSGTTTLAIAMLALGVLVTATRLRRRARA